MLAEFALPVSGGLLIGVASSLLLYTLGRIAGISGIVWAAISGRDGNTWRWLFLAGLMLGAALYHALSGTLAPAASQLGWPFVIGGGLLVGFGTRLGSGCTSGHGVCGIGRLSLRSLTATVTFMITGIATVYVIHHVLHLV